jgi:hypothetical protein
LPRKRVATPDFGRAEYSYSTVPTIPSGRSLIMQHPVDHHGAGLTLKRQTVRVSQFAPVAVHGLLGQRDGPFDLHCGKANVRCNFRSAPLPVIFGLNGNRGFPRVALPRHFVNENCSER